MDRGVVLAHLKVAERYVDTGGRYIDRLRETIDARARGGSDTTATQDLLRHIEAAQEKFVWAAQLVSACSRPIGK